MATTSRFHQEGARAAWEVVVSGYETFCRGPAGTLDLLMDRCGEKAWEMSSLSKDDEMTPEGKLEFKRGFREGFGFAMALHGEEWEKRRSMKQKEEEALMKQEEEARRQQLERINRLAEQAATLTAQLVRQRELESSEPEVVYVERELDPPSFADDIKTGVGIFAGLKLSNWLFGPIGGRGKK